LDQVEAEEWLAHHFDELGVPDQLSVWKAPEWILEEWKYFGRDWKTKVKLVNPPPHEARLQFELAGLQGDSPRAPSLPKSALAEGLVRNVPRLRSPSKRRSTLEKAVEIDPACTAVREEFGVVGSNRGDRTPAAAAARGPLVD